jgi:hypothetical protein
VNKALAVHVLCPGIRTKTRPLKSQTLGSFAGSSHRFLKNKKEKKKRCLEGGWGTSIDLEEKSQAWSAQHHSHHRFTLIGPGMRLYRMDSRIVKPY